VILAWYNCAGYVLCASPLPRSPGFAMLTLGYNPVSHSGFHWSIIIDKEFTTYTTPSHPRKPQKGSLGIQPRVSIANPGAGMWCNRNIAKPERSSLGTLRTPCRSSHHCPTSRKSLTLPVDKPGHRLPPVSTPANRAFRQNTDTTDAT
jgi:hypothetical protein